MSTPLNDLTELAQQAVAETDPHGAGGHKMQALRVLYGRVRDQGLGLRDLVGPVDAALAEATPDPLTAIRALLADGGLVGLPWRVADSTPYDGIRTAAGWEVAFAPYRDAVTRRRLELIVTAVNGLPELLAEVDRLSRELATMTEVAKSNKRHVKAAFEEIDRLTAETSQVTP